MKAFLQRLGLMPRTITLVPDTNVTQRQRDYWQGYHDGKRDGVMITLTPPDRRVSRYLQ